MRHLFRPDSGLMILMTRITDCIFLSLFFIVGCLPVVTAGASLAALYDASRYGLRQGGKTPWQRFWKCFRDNWKASLVPGLVLGVILWAGLSAMIGLWNAAVAGQQSWMVFSAMAMVAVAVLGILSVLFPMLSRFENSTEALLKNTLLLGLGHLPRSLALGMLVFLTVFSCANWVFPVFFLPALSAWLATFLIEPMFRPFLPEEE